MSFDSSDFFLKDHVPESCFKLSLTERRRCDAHRILTTSEQYLCRRKAAIKKINFMINPRLGIDSGIRWTDIWFIGCESSTVERGFGSECFYDQQSPSIVNLPRPADLSGSQREIKQGRTHPRGLIFAACDKVRPVWSQLQIRHHIHMCSLVIENLLSGFSIKEGNFS